MKVKIKDMQVDMDLGANGVVFEVHDNAGQHLGKLRIGMAKIEWCKGKTRIGNGVEKTWDELIKFF